MLEKILSYGVLGTIVVFIIVQIFIHIRKKRIEEFKEDKAKLINSLIQKKQGFSYSTFPLISSHSKKRINRVNKSLLSEIQLTLTEKQRIAEIKNECNSLINRINQLK